MRLFLILTFGLMSAVAVTALVSATDLFLFEDNKCYGINACPGGIVTNIDTDSIQIDGIWINFSLIDIIYEEDTMAFLHVACPIDSFAQVSFDKRYGGMNAEIFCNEKSINGELVERGYAIINNKECRNSDLAIKKWANC